MRLASAFDDRNSALRRCRSSNVRDESCFLINIQRAAAATRT